MDDPRYEAGLKVRREVLGDEHVDRALANATDFTRPFQEYITRSAWGEAWTRFRTPASKCSIPAPTWSTSSSPRPSRP